MDPYTLEQAEEDIAELRGQVSILTEILSLAGGSLVPNAPSSGFTFYSDNGGQPNWIDPAGMSFNVIGSQNCWFPGNTVTGTGLGNLAAVTILGGEPQNTSIYEIEMWGNGTQGSTQQTLEFAVKLGGTTMANLTYGALYMAANTAFRWYAQGRAICHTNGVSGVWTSYLRTHLTVFGATLLSSGASSANATNSGFTCESTGTTTQDSTVNNDLGVSAAWGSATGAPTLTSQVAIAKRLC